MPLYTVELGVEIETNILCCDVVRVSLCISASPFAAVTLGRPLDHDGTKSRPAPLPRQLMQVLPKPWGRLRYIHTSTRTYATLAELRNARINAFVHLADDSKPRPASLDGPLSGMAVAVKDNICTSDMPTTCSSLMLKGVSRVSSSFRTGPNSQPDFSSPYDATVVQLLRTAGAHVVGKTNCDEFGMG